MEFKTLDEAQTQVARMKNGEYRVINHSATRKIGRKAAEWENYEIVEDTGELTVLAKVPSFHVVQVLHCDVCGAEILTRAIGEDRAVTLCPTHAVEREAKLEAEVAQGIEQSAREAARWAARDEWEEN